MEWNVKCEKYCFFNEKGRRILCTGRKTGHVGSVSPFAKTYFPMPCNGITTGHTWPRVMESQPDIHGHDLIPIVN